MKPPPAARAAAQKKGKRHPDIRSEPTFTITRTGKGLQRLLELHDRMIASKKLAP